MKHYLAEIVWNNPYPKKFNYRVSGSNIALGAKRSVMELRKENKGRRIKELQIKITEYGTTQTNL